MWNILTDVTYKAPYSAKPSQIIFDKIYGYIRKYDSNECVALFYSDEKYEWIFDRVRYAIMLKTNVS